MNKKMIICSIGAAIFIVLASLTPVVGFQSVKSNVKASPLFSVRSKRAIDEESRDLACDYVGKGEESIIQLPKRTDITKQQRKMIITLSKMNDKEFNQFLTSILNYFRKQDSNKNENIKEFTMILYQLRNTNDENLHIFTDEKEKHISRAPSETCIWMETCFVLSCFPLLWLLNLLLEIIRNWWTAKICLTINTICRCR